MDSMFNPSPFLPTCHLPSHSAAFSLCSRCRTHGNATPEPVACALSAIPKVLSRWQDYFPWTRQKHQSAYFSVFLLYNDVHAVHFLSILKPSQGCCSIFIFCGTIGTPPVTWIPVEKPSDFIWSIFSSKKTHKPQSKGKSCRLWCGYLSLTDSQQRVDGVDNIIFMHLFHALQSGNKS